MSKAMRTLALLMTAVMGIWSLTGCTMLPCEARGEPAPKPAKRSAPAKKMRLDGACPVVTEQGGVLSAVQAIPTGDPDTSVVLLTKKGPAEVSVGQSFEYTIDVENLTDCGLVDVVVQDTISSNLELDSSSPQARLDGRTAEWALGELDGRETKTVRVKVTPTTTGTHKHCATVSYAHNLCLSVVAVEPQLQLTKSMPPQVLLCDDIPVKLVVTNTGTGTARNVKVSDPLPSGLASVDGQRSMTFDAGDLASGESKEFTFTAKASRTGEYSNAATAKADGGLSAEADDGVVVRQPVLTISKSGPDMLFAGRPARYTITVANTGDTAAQNLVVTDTLPAGVVFKSASAGGVESRGVVTWSVGSLAAGASKEFTVVVGTTAIGRLVNKANAEAVCASPVNAQAVTEVKGIPAILLEVIDVEDPIEVGSNVTYVITATNQGSAVGTNIKIVAEFEDCEQYVSSSGATTARVSGNKVDFTPLASLAPKAKAEWRIVVKATKAADTRFKVEMTSDQIGRPVNETESTNLY